MPDDRSNPDLTAFRVQKIHIDHIESAALRSGLIGIRSAGANLTLRSGIRGLGYGPRRRGANGRVQGKLGFLDTPSGKGFAFAGEVAYDPKIIGDGDAAGVRKSDSDLRDGKYKNIEGKYFPFDMYGK
jgi:hypothetical protein